MGRCLEEMAAGRGQGMKLAVCTATMDKPSDPCPDTLRSVYESATSGVEFIRQHNNVAENLGVIGSYQKMYEQAREKEFDILAYIHDDVYIREKGWDERVLKEFEDPTVGVVGFGGGLGHGTDDIYKTPYRLQQLARNGYLSNVDDAEVHGYRFTSECDVAVLDGFSLVVRRSLLDRCGGWTNSLQFHSYDYFICCMAHRLGYRVRCVGVRCHHLGGRTSTTPQYQEWAEKQGMKDAEVHRTSHDYIYKEFRDVLPWRCPVPDGLGISRRGF